MSVNIDSANWEYLGENELGQRRWLLRTDDGGEIIRTEMRVLKALLDANADERAATHGTKWGDTALIGRVPLNIFYDELHEAVRVGDDKYINKWLNDPDHAAFRTREGRL